jgi:hypothetical protein
LRSIRYSVRHCWHLLNPQPMSGKLLRKLRYGHILSDGGSCSKEVGFELSREILTLYSRCIKHPRMTRHSSLNWRT